MARTQTFNSTEHVEQRDVTDTKIKLFYVFNIFVYIFFLLKWFLQETIEHANET